MSAQRRRTGGRRAQPIPYAITAEGLAALDSPTVPEQHLASRTQWVVTDEGRAALGSNTCSPRMEA